MNGWFETNWGAYVHYWLSLPWACRLFGHRMELRESFNENVPFTPEESWLECSRCLTFGGYR